MVVVNFGRGQVFNISSFMQTFAGTVSGMFCWFVILFFLVVIYTFLALLIVVVLIIVFSMTRNSSRRNALKYKLLISLHFLKFFLRILFILLDCSKGIAWKAGLGILWWGKNWFWPCLIILITFFYRLWEFNLSLLRLILIILLFCRTSRSGGISFALG